MTSIDLEWISVGKVTRAVGLKGICCVDAFGSTLFLLEIPIPVMVGRNVHSVVPMEIEEILQRNKGINCRFTGVSDRDGAEALRGAFIYVDSNILPELEDDEYYHFELRGMQVFTDTDNKMIGVVKNVYNFPAADTLEVDTGGDELLVPMNKDSIVCIEKKAERIIVSRSFIEELL